MAEIIFGIPGKFSLRSSMSVPFERRGAMGIGSFQIEVNGCVYGVGEPNATLLGSSFAEVFNRVNDRGEHTAIFSAYGAADIAESFLAATYSESSVRNEFLGFSKEKFVSSIYERKIQWAPDGDEAFDDGSFVLQFDLKDDWVRLIAFRNTDYGVSDLQDACIRSDFFYETLSGWYAYALGEWNRRLKEQAG